MPGNGVGDRVHNFFAQENLPQGLRSQDGNWSLSDNLWGGNQKQFGVSDSSPRNYDPQQSETERGHGGQHVPDQYMFNTKQTNSQPEFARSMSQSHHEQPSSNGYMYGRQNFQTRPDEANFMGVNTEYGQNNLNQRGSPFYESQQKPVPEQPPKNPFRSESSEGHGSFDLFGGQHQTDSQHPGLLQQPLQQQSGFGDIQQLQQQLMLRKMQELQRQQEIQRQQNTINQASQFARQQNALNQASQFARQQASGSLSHGLVNGTSTSDSSGYGWTEPAVVNPNWLHRASPVSHPEQHVEPSLHGVPVSSSRRLINQYPHNNSFPGNNYAVIPEQHMVPNKGLFGNTFGQGSSTRMKMEHSQQIGAPQNPSAHESPVDTIQDKSATDAAPLDPEEEKILFGSDDNIWEAFGSGKNTTGGVSSLLDDNEFASGLPSMQSGSWSALMQSAVGESTSGGDVSIQEEWHDLNFQNPELPPGKHSFDDSGRHRKPTGLTDINMPNMNDKHHRNMGFQHVSGGSNWLHRGGLQKVDAEENHLYENAVTGQRTPQQHGTSQPDKKKNNWNANEPVPTSLNSGFNMNENDNSLQQSQNNDWKRVSTAATPHLSNLQQGGNHSNQLSPNNHHFNYWKHVDSSVNTKGSENSEIKQHHLNNKGPQVSESSFNSSDKEDLNSSRKENSNDSYRSSSSHLPDTVVQRKHVSSDAGDSRSLVGTKQSSSNQAVRKSSGPGPRKFQYHPMGNLDDDVGVPYGTRQGSHTKPVSLQHSRGLGAQDQGNFGHTKSSAQAFVPEVGVPKGSDDMLFKGMVPGHLPNIFARPDKLSGLPTSDKASQPSQSQNMLELLHKVDQSRDGGIARHSNSLEHDLSSEIPEPENSDGSFGGHQRSQSSNSQGIGLQLGPPSQRSMAMQAVKHNSLSQPQTSANSRGKAHAEPSSLPPFQETSHGEFKNDRMSISGQSEIQTTGNKMMSNLSAALGGTDFCNSRNYLQNHPVVGVESFDGPTSQIRQADERVQMSNSLAGEKLHAFHPHAISGVSQQGAFPKMLTNASSKFSSQLFSATQSHKSQFNVVESTSLRQQNLEEQEAEKRGNKSSLNAQRNITSVEEQSTEKVDRGQMMNGPAAGNDSSTASQKDLEAFGRSLKPNSFHQQISLLNQMKAYKHTNNDTNNRVLKRLNDSDSLLSGQQVTVLPGNCEMPTDNVDKGLASLPANPPSKDALASEQNEPTSVKVENSYISPQMAPSWFDQYGTLKSGQMSSQRADAVRTMEQPFKVFGSLETTAHDSKEPPATGAVDASHDGVIWKSPVPSSVVSQPLQPSITVQNLVTVRPKKRKWSRDEIHSWLKEVSGSSKNLQGIWTTMMEWCEATKRLMEKVEDDGELIIDVPRPKRRVILTTHLMQQLFPPPPPTLLSTEATSNYESVAFYAARLALGDACNLVSCVSHRNSNLLLDKSRESEKFDDRRLSEVVEDCISKAKAVESDFSRLDKRASILDLRVECQDLEKFSIINRFAKFHGRGQADGEASSLSDAAANTPKPKPQRYVVAVTLPKNLPERVQCLSL
ncbi:hypothetical protein SSX86_003808 [Deinandra increscens subsp. villosa]|uniref:Uncharacterized protein n=1 Tax=Deinandra increscens subsp. villosa TaxID=3103831 RepID=A0AAP0DID2_9ASTR